MGSLVGPNDLPQSLQRLAQLQETEPGATRGEQRAPTPAPRLADAAQPEGEPLQSLAQPAEGEGGGGVKSLLSSIEEIFTGPDDPRLSPEQNQRARQRALLQAGLSMVAAANPTTGNAPNFAQVLAIGASQGRSTAGVFADAMATQDGRREAFDILAKEPSRERFLAAKEAAVMNNDKLLLRQIERMEEMWLATRQAQQQEFEPVEVDLGGRKIARMPKATRDALVQQGIPITEESLRQQGLGNTIVELQRDPAEVQQEVFQRADKLVDDFEKRIEDQRDISSSLRKIQNNVTIQEDGEVEATAAGDLALIFLFMKSLDPGSVVREGEFATAANAAGVPERFRNLYNRVLEGKRLSPKQRADFLNTSRRLARGARDEVNQVLRSFRKRAEVAGVPSDVFIDPFEGLSVEDIAQQPSAEEDDDEGDEGLTEEQKQEAAFKRDLGLEDEGGS